MKYLKHKSGLLMSVIIFVLSLGIVHPLYVGATTNGKTQNDAVNWVCARGNEGWNQDVDNAYGCQCVDLIYAYYDYLLGYRQSGNASDYIYNTPPAGWSKVYSNPQPGDVVVWGAGAQMGWYPLVTSYADKNFGHIGIVWRVNASGTLSTIEANGYQGMKAAYYERYPNNVACYIRPDFSSGGTSVPEISDGIIWSTKTPTLTETNAIVQTHVTPPGRIYLQWSGCNFFDANGREIAKAGETAGFNASYIDMTWNVNEETWTHYSLQPGTTYKYQFYATWDGVDHFSPMYTFTTPHTHTYVCEQKKATLSDNGKIVNKCSLCKKVSSEQTVYYPATFALSTTNYVYDGMEKNPDLVIKDSAGNVISPSNYTETKSSGRRNVGTYSYEITFRGIYSGTKTVFFNIDPPRTSIKKVTAGRKKFTVSWNYIRSQISGYQVQYASNAKFSGAKTVSLKKSARSYTKNGLKAKKKFYVRVRTYKKSGTMTYYSAWTAAKRIITR